MARIPLFPNIFYECQSEKKSYRLLLRLFCYGCFMTYCLCFLLFFSQLCSLLLFVYRNTCFCFLILGRCVLWMDDLLRTFVRPTKCERLQVCVSVCVFSVHSCEPQFLKKIFIFTLRGSFLLFSTLLCSAPCMLWNLLTCRDYAAVRYSTETDCTDRQPSSIPNQLGRDWRTWGHTNILTMRQTPTQM